ncbi:hypothetical protein V8Z74_14915 [Comamonas sp. w2-DMI]|uniref:hypothetical protein n=1 Tax=Comamonas sp. w2-DMI TaxID=3126391 RepID=UPI0032E4A899
MLFPLMPGRAGVYTYAFGYHGATVYGLMGFAASWFDNSLLMGALAWSGIALLASLVWPLLSKGSCTSTPVRAGVGVALGLLIGLLPPFALVLDGHPVVAWGYILKGWGFFGVATAIALTGFAAALVYSTRGWVLQRYAIAACLLLITAAGAVQEVPTYRAVEGVVGLDTHFGKPPANDDEQVERYSAIKDLLLKSIGQGGDGEHARVLVLPENSLNLDDPALTFLVESKVLRPLKKAGKSAVVGKLALGQDGYLNQAALIEDGQIRATVDQRQPALLSMWRPWNAEHFPMDWRRDTAMQIGSGMVGRIMVCYEEYIPVLFMLDELRGGHDLSVIISSNWSATDRRLPEIQRLHSLGMAKMFDRAVVRAVNYPSKETP